MIFAQTESTNFNVVYYNITLTEFTDFDSNNFLFVVTLNLKRVEGELKGERKKFRSPFYDLLQFIKFYM